MNRYALITFIILTFSQYKSFGQIVPIKDANKPYDKPINKANNKMETDFDFSVFNEDIKLQFIAPEEECIEEDTRPFVKVQQMPSFQGGDLSTFRNWVRTKVIYPQYAYNNNIQGRVVSKFVIERDGSLTNIEILQSPDHTLSDEVIRVLKTSPKWKPGIQRESPVRVVYTLPVDFRIFDGSEDDPKFTFPGFSSFSEWIQNKLKNPLPLCKDYSKRVRVRFVIEKDGSIGEIQILYSPSTSLSKKAIKALKSSPKWEPGKINNKVTEMTQSLSIYFK